MTPAGVAAPTQKPSRDETLVKAFVRAHRWRRWIESNQSKSITDLAEHEGVTVAYVCRLLPLTCLAPDIVAPVSERRSSPPANNDGRSAVGRPLAAIPHPFGFRARAPAATGPSAASRR